MSGSKDGRKTPRHPSGEMPDGQGWIRLSPKHFEILRKIVNGSYYVAPKSGTVFDKETGKQIKAPHETPWAVRLGMGETPKKR